jgi:hypothetical protein
MRHTTASLLINKGLHPKVISEHLGHHTVSITLDRYGHLYETDSQRLADALDAAFATGLVKPETPETIPVAGKRWAGTQSQEPVDPTESAVTQAGQGV